jgi:tRNA dimethylallyltransferase
VGKTAISIELAKKIRGEIVSADSMQLYRGMNIGTAKPSLEDRKEVPHHLFDVLNIEEHCDVASFRNHANEAIQNILSRKMVPIIVGGSGMYVRALTQGLFEGPGRDEALRKELDKLETSELKKRLQKADPVAASKIGDNDRKRMFRALEIYELTGKPISELQQQWKATSENAEATPSSIICLNRPREELYERCNKRVDQMFEKGFVEEVQGLMVKGLEKSPTAAKAIGYPEMIRHLKGELNLLEARELVKQKTRNFVKRQLSWFRKEPGIQWLDIPSEEVISTTVSRIVALIRI